MKEFFWIFCSVGATHIIVGTAIFQWLRNFMDKISPRFFGILFNCPTCMGFWVSIILSTVMPIIPISFLNCQNIWLFYFLHGCFGSGINWFGNLITTYVNEKITEQELKNAIIVENPLEVAKQLLNG